ncbi:MAG: pyruvate dehydrogenase E2 component (dihydrolipoamide acetyltransferase) [Chloroflexi bacterium]|jgi:pyruvate dehydrogenase E2 component (dihydrolipoamide acetyltransferase)|nr:MAG: pyruvate dehydrogenase E2 component (dihydrolipoamide acetyltransferase) [Chloroflexota bacterium]
MAVDFIFPNWGVDDEAGQVVRWLKTEGESVDKGDPIVEIESAKVIAEVSSPASGILARIVVPEGGYSKAGDLLAVITPVSSYSGQKKSDHSKSPPFEPSTLRLAEAYGIDIRSITRSTNTELVGPDEIGELIDNSSSNQDVRRVPIVGIRKTISDRLYKSLTSTAQVTINTEADATESEILRQKLISDWRSQRIRPMALALLIKASAKALVENPRFNATISGDEIQLHKQVNIGFAVAIESGLVVPVVVDANLKPLIEISREVKELAIKAPRNLLKPAEMAHGTFTITSMGAYEVDAFTPIINPPQVAILGTGRLVEKPVVHKSEITKRLMVTLSLTFDHRAVDGAPAGAFLKAIKQNIEEPSSLAN